MIQDLNFSHQQRNEIKGDTHQFGTVNSFIHDDAVEEFRRVFGVVYDFFRGLRIGPALLKEGFLLSRFIHLFAFRIEYMRWMVLMQI
jgi:hypothetical protein